jgi:lipoprotein-releasing system permease protein
MSDRAARWTGEELPQPWSAGEAIAVAWSRVWGELLPLALPLVLILAATTGVGWFSWKFFSHMPVFPALKQIWTAATTGSTLILVDVIARPMLLGPALMTARGEAAGLGSVLMGLERFPALLVVHLVLFVSTLLPTFNIIPCLLCLAPFYVVDQDMGPIQAMRASWKAASDNLGSLWVFHVAMLPLLLCGIVVGGVGSIISAAMYYVGIGYAYARATGRTEQPLPKPEWTQQTLRTLLRAIFVALLIGFASSTAWVYSLPALRGSAWSIKDTAIRATAIVTGVGAIIAMLALMLPWILDRLEGRTFASFVSARHVRSQKSGFLTIISLLSIGGVAMSSCTLSGVVSIMGGFSQDLKRKILGNNAHIVIDTPAQTNWSDYEAVLGKVRAVPGVVGATPVVHGEVMISSASNLAGVIVRGIDPASIKSVIELASNIEVGKFEYLEDPDKLRKLPPTEVIGIGPGGEQYLKGTDLPSLPDDLDPLVREALAPQPLRPGIIIGRELAKTLHVYVGDEITLVSPLGDLGPMGVMPRTKKFRVAAIFYSGMYEYDASHVYTTLESAQEYFAATGKVTVIDVKVDDAERADQMTPVVESAIGRKDLRVRDWREMNKNLFSALKLEKIATFIILSIAIMVSSFCIICTLLLMVTEKGKEIAILKAVGASDGAIQRTFMMEGIIIGAIGTTFGVATGLALCTGLKWFGLRLDPDVYYIDRLPIAVNGWDFLAVAAAAFTICALATIYPARAASRLRPVEGLRYE